MPRMFTIGVLVGLLGVSVVQAETLDISIDALGAAYNSMVRDAKLRGDGGGGIEDANLGTGTGAGSSNRIYANFLLDGTTPSGRLNTFLQWFDVSSIPAGSIINSAILTQYFSNSTANNRTFVDLHLSQLQPGKNWIEGIGLSPATDGSVTWNSQISGSTLWAAPGATGASDIFLATTQTFDLVGVDGTATTINRDITSWVQDWVNTPSNNTGMLWWGGNNADSASGNRYFMFGVKEDGAGPAGEASFAAPRLLIDYTPVPEPGGFALLAAGLLTLIPRRRKVS